MSAVRRNEDSKQGQQQAGLLKKIGGPIEEDWRISAWLSGSARG
jgi:hypothetical protein